MTFYMPPIATKKRSGTELNLDTKRVFGNYEENLPPSKSHYSSTHKHVVDRKPSPAKPLIVYPGRQHNPHPSQVGFLLQDCRLIHEPICNVKPQAKKATDVDPENEKWWKWIVGCEEAGATRVMPKYSYNSSNRDEYRKPEKPQMGQTRHCSNPEHHVSKGIVPITSLASERGPRLLVEHISYNHQYNSRTNPSQPIRGKKHGSFVWDCFHPVSPSELTTKPTRTVVLSAPWASTIEDQGAGGSFADLPFQNSCSRSEIPALGTLDSSLPQSASLPPVAF